ncbi:RhoGAP-domain-containing protein [Podospora didyma]|uniref:RhoGAP-domain-containing protein n=1 Tax=Podospora didyma TaxID=330526 RepID=A0AAE0N5Y7_9PEZI|nr:RhoGAP-domain-containing protein [Podospora didyma]
MSLGDGPAAAAAAVSENGGGLANNNGSNNNTSSPQGDETSAQVQDVLSSEIGISAMLNRLKQSIASAKEFALFLKRRSALEEEHSNGLRKLCRMSQDSIARSEHRGGSFAKAYEDMMAIHERMADNGSQFASSLHTMHEDLIELAAIAEKSRKGWKQNGLLAEQRVAELEAQMRKSKAKYDALAEEYDRARTGDTSGRQGGKMFGFKGPKSAAQHEEELLRKAQAADQDYQSKVQVAQQERGELIARTRPETVKALQDITRECDSGVVLQMQKFASFNEKLLLSNGLSISPLKNGPDARSLRECVSAINNEKDLNDYISSHYSRMPPKTGPPKYERNPVRLYVPLEAYVANFSEQLLDQQTRVPTLGPMGHGPPPGSQQGPMPGPMFQGSMNSRANTFSDSPLTSPTNQGSIGHSYGQNPGPLPPLMGGAPRPSSQPQHERNFSQGSGASQNNGMPAQMYGGPPRGPMGGQQPPQQQQQMPNSRFNGPPSTAPSQGPPQLGALSFQTSQPQQPPQFQAYQPPRQQQHAQYGQPQQSPQPQILPYGQPPPHQGGPNQGGPNSNPLKQNPLQQNPPTPSGPSALQTGAVQTRNQSPPAAAPQMSPSRPVFGFTLSRLYERDGQAVPSVVTQCIQAVDLFGLTVEGIYRLSGSVPHVNKLKNLFDTDSNSPSLDFRNPENFFHDVNSVAGLLKQFFRDLPDPLLTKEHYAAFVEAAKNEDDVLRRDSLHAIINSLPDPNYATLRALTLHLHRVMDNAGANRMSCQNLAIVFGPTLMGTAPGSNISDAGWQVRVVDTILQNTYQIFDDDD